MITIIPHKGGPFKAEGPLNLEQLQALVDGFVELHELSLQGFDNQEPVQVICNEDAWALGLPTNPAATLLFSRYLNLGPKGALGTWVVLTNSDRLD